MLSVNDMVQRKVDEIYRHEARKVYASLIRLLGDFDLAEEALHDAFSAALTQWAEQGYRKTPALGWSLRAASKPLTIYAVRNDRVRLSLGCSTPKTTSCYLMKARTNRSTLMMR